MSNANQIAIETIVCVSPAEAWKAFTSPDAIVQWNQASPDWHCPSARVDLRVGGEHFARMEARDGSTGFDFTGVYEEVDAPTVLTLRLADGRRATTTFKPNGTSTRVKTVFDPEATNPVEMQRDGWQSILDSYAQYVERTTDRLMTQ
ncbi:MAG: SRPBCC domain-containing protein [Phycisphaeraceae bacterium]|nr:SRPBCC domain-containing protein [Phycisphaeraceae bacterium]MBX3368279.1 SRPBCC domain-containing protein [Phycisphaeraceae bacterium]